jgi:protein subunit release factor B
MLFRMYLKWAERRGFKREVVDYQPGDDAGLKSATLEAALRRTRDRLRTLRERLTSGRPGRAP